MATGKTFPLSPIVKAIAWVEKNSTAEIRVHVTKKWFDQDPMKSAIRIFNDHEMDRNSYQNSVLLYFNQRKKTFAILGGAAFHKRVGQSYWESLAINLRDDLYSTHFENAVALAIRTIGFTLQKYFPPIQSEKSPGAPNP